MTWAMDDIRAFIHTIDADDFKDEASEFKKLFELLQNVLDNAYLARSALWGVATGLENQISYIGSNFRANLERRLNTLENPRGILAEDDLMVHKFANESHPHINNDSTVSDQAEELKLRIDQLTRTMSVAAVGYTLAVRTHDEISQQLGQMTYHAIKSRALSRRSEPVTVIKSMQELANKAQAPLNDPLPQSMTSSIVKNI